MTTAQKTTQEAIYRERTPGSYEAFIRSGEFMPGVAKGAYYYAPYPVTVERAEGCHLYDVDGNEYVDFANHHTTQILGHNHPAIVRAVERQLAHGIAVAAPMGVETALAEALCRRVKSLDMVRFCNSGTEATLHAIRLAREYTGRHIIAKFEGGYHGSHDAVEISTSPDPAKAGPSDRPIPVAGAGGMPPNATDNVIILPFDDEAAVEAIVAERRHELAAVILDPKTGVIPQRLDFVKAVREITAKYEVLLILDEIVGFRASPGGVQAQCGILPDLSTYGKIVGGGFPVGAFGGRKELMSLMDPTRGKARVFQSGSFSAHPVSMAAGLAMLEVLTPDVYARLDRLTDRLVNGLEDVFAHTGTGATAVASGSTFSIYFTRGPIRTYRAVAAADKRPVSDVYLALLNRGCYLSNGLAMNCLSAAMDESHIDGLVAVVAEVLEEN
ncbi:MAG: aspartate aminotransferase family protein [Gemmatimonadetes bacterium]|nr:aspartate aminotransferase family protein [Gemmatimonadota bacterium]